MRACNLTTTSTSRPQGPPSWVLDLLDDSSPEKILSPSFLAIERRTNDIFTLVSVEIPQAEQMDAETFRHRTRQAYDSVFDVIGEQRHLIRVWNFIPGILAPLGTLPQRYMEFNRARYEAYAKRYDGAEAFGSRVATASGVGTTSGALELHALAMVAPGMAVENPRQESSYRYSEDYGPLPPCFARATRLAHPTISSARLLVGGTAAICGEETVCLGNLDGQINETLMNLAAVVSTALGDGAGRVDEDATRRDLLGRYRHLRVYYTMPEDYERVSESVAEAFAGAEHIELARADLCRQGLLVEIEGWADLGR